MTYDNSTRFCTLVVPVESSPGEFVVALDRGLFHLRWDRNERRELKKLLEVEEGVEGNRFNDGKVDPRGRLWAGDCDMIFLFFSGIRISPISLKSIKNALLYLNERN